MLQMHLQLVGYKVETAAGLQEALAQVESKDFDLFILDHLLEDGSGAELREMLRQRHPAIPALYYTGTLYSADQIGTLHQAGDAYLLKPVEPELLKATIHHMLTERNAPRSIFVPMERWKDE